MTKQVAKKEESNMPAIPQGSWGAEGLSADDILLPKILLMQPMSELVVDEQAAPGEMLDSLTKEKLGDQKKDLEIIPINMFKTWVISRKDGQKFKFVKQEPRNAANDNLPLEYTENGIEYRRDKVLNFYCLKASEAKNPDALPIVASFRRTSTQAGKQIATHFQKAVMMGKPPACKTLKLISKKTSNDKGTYYIFDVTNGRSTEAEEIQKAFQWHQQIKSAGVKVDDADLTEEAGGTTSAATQREEF